MKKNTSKFTAPYGSWVSPITASMVAGKSPKISDPKIVDNRLFWCESLASEKGRSAIMMYDGEQLQCILPRPLSAKSKVHEYGGAPFAIMGQWLYFVLADDQRIYRGDLSEKDFKPSPITPEGTYRFANLEIDRAHNRIIAVVEDHKGPHHENVENALIAIDLNAPHGHQTIASGHDFYSSPTISPDGQTLAWIAWDHPNMPWDNSELWVAQLTEAGADNKQKIAGNGSESICQPAWSPRNELYFVSDRDNWWNIYTAGCVRSQRDKSSTQAVTQEKAEFATPPWVFGMSNYGFISEDTILAAFTQNGSWQLAEISLKDDNRVIPVDVSCTDIQSIVCQTGKAAFIGASPTTDNNIYFYQDRAARPLLEVKALVDPTEYSRPLPIEFSTSNNETAQALFYPPHNSLYENDEALPPLIVICHGGPTGATESSLNLKIQFWTSRGFAVADVNYRGSTGYGREFRHRLFDKWGIYDVDDVCAVVDHLAEQGRVDKARCVIKGSSAGGYTVLAALAFRNTFSAGVSLYGIGDLEALARDTHKFEARYLDRLVGPYPEERDTYYQRSPVHFVDNINCPLLIFQGLQDKVVPPNQAKSMFDAVKEKGLPVAYVTYPNEAHGFRDAATVEHMLTSELQFYATLFGFDVEISTVELKIENI